MRFALSSVFQVWATFALLGPVVAEPVLKAPKSIRGHSRIPLPLDKRDCATEACYAASGKIQQVEARWLQARAPAPPPLVKGEPSAPRKPIPGDRGDGSPPPPGKGNPPIGIPKDPNSPPVKLGPYTPRTIPQKQRVLSMQEYLEKGQEVRKILDDAIATRKPDVNRMEAKLLYRVEKNKAPIDLEDVPAPFTKIAGLKEKQNTFTEIAYSNDPSKLLANRRFFHVNQAFYSAEARTIDVRFSFAKEDFYPDGVRLPWSELVFQGYKSVAGDVKSLQFVMRSEIDNPGTLKVIDALRRQFAVPKDKIGIFKPDKPRSAMDNAFSTLSGTDNVKGVYHMLADKHVDFGDLKVIKIYTSKDEFLLIELGH